MKTLCAFLALLIFFVACKKDNAVEITQESVAGTYQLNKVSFKDETGGYEKDVSSSFIADCAEDDLYTFKANGDYIFDEASIQCGLIKEELAKWYLYSTTTINIKGRFFTLESFDGNTFVITYGYVYNDTRGKLKKYFTRQ
jgi:hypothetical protein